MSCFPGIGEGGVVADDGHWETRGYTVEISGLILL